MHLKIERSNPDNIWKPYVCQHWIIGQLTKRQLRWVRKFSYQNSLSIAFVAVLKWAMIACVAAMICAPFDSSVAETMQVAIPVACIFFAFINMLVSGAACEYADKLLANRQLIVSEKHMSWKLLCSEVCLSELSRYSGEQAAAITKYFQDTASHDELLKQLEDQPDDYNRVVDDILAKARSLQEEFMYLAQLENVMTRTQEELATDAAAFDIALESERKSTLHERVNLLLSQQPR